MEGLGEFLRKGREEVGVSLEELARKTRIRIESLQALEREDLDALPTDIYVRGFVKLVCRELGLAPEDGIVRYEALRSHSAPPDEIIWSEEKEASRPGWLEEALKDPERVVRVVRAAMRWGVVGLAGVLLVVVGVMGTRWLGGDDEPASPAVAAADVAAPAEEEGAAGAPAGAKPPPETSEPPAAEPPPETSEPPARRPSVDRFELITPRIPERTAPGRVRPGEPVVTAARDEEPPAPRPTAERPPPAPALPAPVQESPPESGARLVLVVEALRPVEVEVLLDGIGHPREKSLAGGERKAWKADSLFLLTASDGGAIRLRLDGTDLGVAGPDGEPITQARIAARP